MTRNIRRANQALASVAVLLLVVAVTATLRSSPTSLAGAAAAPVGWSLLQKFGASEGGGPGTLGMVGGAVLGDSGRVVVLDVVAKKVRVFDRGGRTAREMGREGAGPGEFRDPVALTTDPGGRVYVLDRINRRVEVFEAGSGTPLGGFRVPFAGEDLCFLGERLFLLGAHGGNLLHEASPADGRILRSFAPDGDSSDLLLSSYRASGYLACGPGDEVAFLPLLRPEVTRFRASTGERAGTAPIPGYRAVKVSRRENGAVVFEAPEGGVHDYAASIVSRSSGGHLVQVGPIPQGATTRHEFESTRSFVVSWQDDTVREIPGELPRLMYVRNDTALAALTSPAPAVWMVDLESRGPEDPQ
ncbi:MAG TPA: 6-bladed beta-propeller [Longimicrobiaceae bacterium]|nr:6-bladed beta-propeller [Longimicrobiaceae bacterium]